MSSFGLFWGIPVDIVSKRVPSFRVGFLHKLTSNLDVNRAVLLVID